MSWNNKEEIEATCTVQQWRKWRFCGQLFISNILHTIYTYIH